MNLLSSATVFSFFTLISRILGYLRDILIAILLGASIFADAFFVAFRLPNTFRRLFAEGTFNAACIPSYTSAKIEDKKKGTKFADDVLSSLLIILLFFTITAPTSGFGCVRYFPFFANSIALFMYFLSVVLFINFNFILVF